MAGVAQKVLVVFTTPFSKLAITTMGKALHTIPPIAVPAFTGISPMKPWVSGWAWRGGYSLLRGAFR